MSQENVEVRARAWRNALHASVCDVLEPWATARSCERRAADLLAFNVVRVEEDPAMSVGSSRPSRIRHSPGSRTGAWTSISSMPPSRCGRSSRRRTGRPPA